MPGVARAVRERRSQRIALAGCSVCVFVCIAFSLLILSEARAQEPPPATDPIQAFPLRSARAPAGRAGAASAELAAFPRAGLLSDVGPAGLSQKVAAAQIVINGAPQGLHTQLSAAIGVAAPLTLAEIVETVDQLVRWDAAATGVIRIATIDAALADRGIVRIDVGEPQLEMAAVAGAPTGVRTYLDAMFSQMRSRGPLTERRLERYLMLFNRVPGCKARMALESSDSHTRRPRLVLHVEYDRLKVRADVSNRLPRGVGREALYAKVVFSDVLSGADVVDLRVRSNVAPGEALFLDGTYGVNLDADGMLLEIGAFASNIQPEASRTGGGQLAISGRNYTLSLTKPVFLSEDKQFFLSGGLSSAGFTVSIDEKGAIDEDRWLAYAKGEWLQRGFGGLNSTVVTLNRGLDIGDATERGAPLASRGGEGAGVTFLTFEFARERAWTPWALLATEAFGQVSTRALQIVDQCTYGGRDFGRAFDPNAIFGDTCFLAKAELRLTPGFLRTAQFRFEPYVYADGGVLHQVGVADPSQARDASRMSAALGAAINGPHGLSAKVELTQALRRQTTAGTNEERSFFFELGVDF